MILARALARTISLEEGLLCYEATRGPRLYGHQCVRAAMGKIFHMDVADEYSRERDPSARACSTTMP
jgi:hypothetical protein